MSELKYKVGDSVLIKSIDWYNKYKDEDGDVSCGEFVFVEGMKKFCSEIMTISEDGGDGYLMLEDNHGYVWTDEMFECKVEEGTKPKFKVGDKVILDPYPCVVTDVHWRDSLHGFVYTVRGADFGMMVGEEDLIFDTSKEETPKFKVNDIVFVKNLGWVRITNNYWDSLTNEYIYEAIGFNGKGEYDNINQSNIECQMLPESENPHTCGNKITLDEYKNNDKEWLFNKLAMLDNITALESIQDIFNHLQQSKYPKTYEECCEILEDVADCSLSCFACGLLNNLQKLLLCRDAYWKIAGEEMGLSEPWEPDWKSLDPQYIILYQYGGIDKAETHGEGNYILTFPTEEMRDIFYENFKEEIEKCKELL